MKIFLITILSLFLSSCAWVGVKVKLVSFFDFGGKIQDELRFGGM